CRFVEWTARYQSQYDLLINCTSVGMHPNVDETPYSRKSLRSHMVVFDTVYTPETTLLVKEARACGCHVITGVERFVRQAAQQFHYFTVCDVPVDLLRKTLKRALSPVTIKEEEPPEEDVEG